MPKRALDEVTEHIEARQMEEQGSGVVPALEEVTPSEEAADPSQDPLHAWKNRASGEVTLADLHQGLIAVSQFSEAAIEGGIKMAADVHKALPHVEKNTAAIQVIASKLEAVSSFSDGVDKDVAKLSKTMNVVRKDVQVIKDDLREVKAATAQIPAIKEILGEILARLPEPETKKRTKK